jgi:putative transposase
VRRRSAVCGAGYRERSEDRVNSRNGYRVRGFDTRVGTIAARIPKLRTGSYFPDWLLERRRRAEAALVTVVATSYLLGVSTQRMERLVEQLGITRLSKSQVSEMAKDLDAQVEAFRTRPLDAGPYTFVAADAVVLKVRETGRVVKVHALIATGVNAEGFREILGLQVSTAEDGAGWLGFFRDLVARGLSSVALVTSDAHPGLVDAIGAALPGASWQRSHPLRRQPDEHHPEIGVGMGQGATALGLRPARRRVRARPVRPGDPGAGGEAPGRGRAPRRGPSRHPRLHRLPEGDLAADLVQQPPTNASTGRSAAAPTSSASSATAKPCSGWSARCSPSSTTNGPRCAATSASRCWPSPESPRSPTKPTTPGPCEEVTATAITA